MSTITDAMVEAATMALLGKTKDPLPGIDWWASRQWRVNKVRAKMRKALETAFAAPAAAQGAEEMWPTNSYLLNYLCKRIGIELGKDNIATAIKKANAALAAPLAPEGAPCRTCGSNEPFTGSCGTSDDDSRALCKRAPEAAPSADVAKALGDGKELLSKYEQHAILEDPGAIIRLVNHHDAHEAMAEASDMPESATHHMKRAHELLTIGRMVILRDPDLWDAALKAEFAPRAREA